MSMVPRGPVPIDVWPNMGTWISDAFTKAAEQVFDIAYAIVCQHVALNGIRAAASSGADHELDYYGSAA